jgi:hypothetical protein
MKDIDDRIKKAEEELFVLKKQKREAQATSTLVDDILFLKNRCGSMWLCGKSGKINEPNYTVEIKINSFGGCVAIPDLAMNLAVDKIEGLTKD